MATELLESRSVAVVVMFSLGPVPPGVVAHLTATRLVLALATAAVGVKQKSLTSADMGAPRGIALLCGMSHGHYITGAACVYSPASNHFCLCCF